jgi:hypothetical protein
MATAEKKCNICLEVLGPEMPELDKIFMHGVWTCRVCLNNTFRRTIHGDDAYPASINGQAIDLGVFSAYVDHELLAQYLQLIRQQSVPPYLSVYCAAGHFIGRTVAANPINPFGAVGECTICKKTACMACKNPLSKEYPIASALSHGCNAKIKAAEEDHQRLLDGEDRGTHYQVCPTCRRYINLHSDCHHITCRCKKQFCYLCGVRTKGKSHWGDQVWQCPLYPNKLSPAQVAFELLSPEDQQRAIRAALLDVALGLDDDPLADYALRERNAVWALQRLLEMGMEEGVHEEGAHDQADDGQPGPAYPVAHHNMGIQFDQEVGGAIFEALHVDMRPAAIRLYAAAHQRLAGLQLPGDAQAANHDNPAIEENQANEEVQANEDDPALEEDLPEPAQDPAPDIEQPRGTVTVLHGIQFLPRLNWDNPNQLDQEPERDMEWEREEAEQAHDDALRAAEYLVDFPPLGAPLV